MGTKISITYYAEKTPFTYQWKRQKKFLTIFFRFRENGQNAFLAPGFKISKNRLNCTLWHIKLKGLTPSWTSKWKKWVLGSWVCSRAQKGVLGGALGGLKAQSHETYLLWHIKLKDLPHSGRLKWKKWVLGPWAHPRPQKWVFGPIEGPHFTKSPNIPIVTYQIKGFASLRNIKMKKMSFGTLGPTPGPKNGYLGPLRAPFHKVTKHTYCDISN